MNKNNKKTIAITSLIIISIIIIYNLLTKEEFENNFNISGLNEYEENNKIENNQTEEINENENKILVHISGAIKNEGVYELKEGSRIVDVIDKSGGLTEEANINSINLAYILQDGIKIHIPKKDENINELQDETDLYVSKENGDEEEMKSIVKTNKNIKININTATQTELETLPGIGPSTASKIIEYRKENGKFNNIEDIKKVSGIGESKFSKIKDQIKV